MKFSVLTILFMSILSKEIYSQGRLRQSAPQSGSDATRKPLWQYIKEGIINTTWISQYVGNIDADRDQDGKTALMWSASKGYRWVAQLLLQKGANINVTDRFEYTPLTIAARFGRKTTVEMLVQNGANLEAVNDDSFSALHEAVWNGHVELAEWLIHRGISFDTTEYRGYTPIMMAALFGHKSLVELLLTKGAYLDSMNEDQFSALHEAVYNGHIKIALLLIEKGININAREYRGYTALTMAAVLGHLEVAEALIVKGAHLNTADFGGYTPLMWAIDNNHDDVAQLLIRSNANIEVSNNDGNTALHLAVTSGRVPIVTLLLQNGSNRRIRNNLGKSAIDIAIDNGPTSKEIEQLLTNNQTFTRKTVSERACDVYSRVLSDRILHGDLAANREFPWMEAALDYLNRIYKISFDCGGTLISDQFVLTAAHCVRDLRRPVVVRLGKVTLTDDIEWTNSVNHQIREIIPHSKYSNINKKNDIALIRLVNRVWFTDLIKPACLQTDTRDEHANVSLTVTGWGIVSPEWRTRSDSLLKANLQTMPLSECNRIFLEFNKHSTLAALQNGVSESQYCAHDPRLRIDSCEGDSGGPLQIIQPEELLARVVGIVSFGIGCGSSLPGIYTRVAYYLDWIESYVWPNGAIIKPLVNKPNNNI